MLSHLTEYNEIISSTILNYNSRMCILDEQLEILSVLEYWLTVQNIQSIHHCHKRAQDKDKLELCLNLFFQML
jgi:hypothetical protein